MNRNQKRLNVRSQNKQLRNQSNYIPIPTSLPDGHRNVVVYDPLQQDNHAIRLKELIHEHQLDELEQSVLCSMTLPREAPAIGIGANYGSMPTYTTNPSGVLDWAPMSIDYLTMPKNVGLFFKFRDINRSIVYWDSNLGLAPYQYTGNFTSSVNTKAIRTFPVLDENVAVLPNQPHGTTLAYARLGESDQFRGLLMNYAERLDVTIDAASLNTGVNYCVQWYKLTGRIWELAGQQEQVPTPGQDLVFTGFSAPDLVQYVAFSISQVYVTTHYQYDRVSGHFDLVGSGAITTPTKPGLFKQRQSAQLETVLNSISGARVNASSLKLTNSTPELYKSGRIVMKQLPSYSDWIEYAGGAGDYLQLLQFKDSAVIPTVNGAYAFSKPASPDSFKMQDYAPYTSHDNDSDGDVISPNFDLFSGDGPLMFFLQISGGDTVVGFGSFTITTTDVVEFSSKSQWFNQMIVRMPPDALDKILMALSEIPQYHTNDFHFEDIWNAIKGVASDIWSGIKEVAPVVAPFLPLLLSPTPPKKSKEDKKEKDKEKPNPVLKPKKPIKVKKPVHLPSK